MAIGEGAAIGDNTVIFPNVTIGPGARVGADCVIHSNVALRERVTIGNRVILQNGVVIGSDGYGFVRRGDGTHEKIPQVATVVIEDDVELGANTTVDRPAVGETRIRSGTKIDNLVQIGHGVTVGRNVLMAAQVGIAGSTDIEDDVVFGGQVGVGGHLTIGRGSIAVGQSGVTNSLDAGAMVAGYPAIDSREWRKASVIFKRLPELKRRIEELEARAGRADRSQRRRARRPVSVMRGVLVVLALAAAGVAPAYAQTPAPVPAAGRRRVPVALRLSRQHGAPRQRRSPLRVGRELRRRARHRRLRRAGARRSSRTTRRSSAANSARSIPTRATTRSRGPRPARIGAVEAAGVFHHVSRHLSDRPKRFPVDWNMIGGRIAGIRRARPDRAARRASTSAASSRRRTSTTAGKWKRRARRASRFVPGWRSSRAAASGCVGVDGSRDRGTQYGFRGEGGVRLDGRGAALELFVAAERRLDPYQLEFSTVTWLTMGFRISSPAPLRMP